LFELLVFYQARTAKVVRAFFADFFRLENRRQLAYQKWSKLASTGLATVRLAAFNFHIIKSRYVDLLFATPQAFR